MEKRTVTVKQLPETLTVKQGNALFREIQSEMNTDRPRMVLDCSNVRQLDKPFVHLLLCCLEEAMKRNGDVRLAALPAGSEAVLEQTGIKRVFDIYDTAAEAESSYHQVPADEPPQKRVPLHSPREPEGAV